MMFSQCNSQLTEHVDYTYHIQFAIATEQGVRIRPHILNLNLKFTKFINKKKPKKQLGDGLV